MMRPPFAQQAAACALRNQSLQRDFTAW
ncbi:hypothetical protein R2601_14765 [Salipiger bermudensis HTCC2601]|uniref:Uncharacterized protein n=1 Tax=Salipiger bermudensis (strain DSM 26914 / JCM 13377 / KCTC 12554 / HTCC2601) TaxID=314265 RepID=Q0FV89_SALBH|nr:hypothetical protein R2601_14765 [Salipiger bermudensis HTCC2601]